MSKSGLFACLVLLSVVAIASSQTDLPKRLPTLPLEKYDNPPAPFPLLGIGVSPGMLSQEGPFTSHQVNVDANGMNIVGDAANEPSIAVDPTNGSRIVIGWRQFNSVTSNFRQAGWGYTADGGATWTFPGVLENNVFRSDPVLGSDDTGHFFYLSLLQTFFDNMWRSLDGGQTFTNLGPATGGDKQWFTIDNTSSSGHGFQYQCWDTSNNYGTRLFSRSTDGGVTWMDPIDIPNSPIFGTPDVDSNGNLFIGGMNDNTGQFWCIRSTDAKNGGVTPTFDQSTPVNLGGFISSGTINPVGLAGQLFLAVDRSGTSTNNNVYMLASVQPTGFSTGNDVMFVRSTDGGQTFTAPKRVNDDPINHNKWHWLGTFSVAPNGRIDSVWLDTRNAANDSDSQLFYSFSLDGGDTWSPNVAVSDSFDPHVGYPMQNKMGDYITMVSDNTGGNVAYTATFNLEEDIYYVRVAPGTAPTPTPSPTLTPMPPSQALNLSTRMLVQGGDNVGIGGFIITGSAPKEVLLRGIGPSLAAFGVSNALADPTLELRDASGQLIASNDDWCTPLPTPTPTPAGCAQIIATGIPPSNDLESAILVTLSPGPYTAIVKGKNNTSGVALVEVYDLAQAAASKLGNISTRAFVSTGSDIVIAGFILGGDSGNDNVILRGIGPSLTAFWVPNALANPTLELRDSNGALIRADNDWQDDPAQAAIITAAGLAPTNNLESGIAATLAPGQYTALLAGVNSGTGLGLVEVYDLGAP